MLPAAHGLALVTPASRGLGFALAQQVLAQTQLPVVATGRKDCDGIRERLLSSKHIPADAESRLRVLRVDVIGKSSPKLPRGVDMLMNGRGEHDSINGRHNPAGIP